VRDNKGMIISSPYLIILSAEEHAELTVRATGARAAHRDVVRAHIILAAADGRSNAAISNGWPDSPIGLGPDGHAGSAPCRSLR
jgi:hypothetical protein